MDTTGLDRSEARSLLAKFGLGADHIERVGADLSPGERTRALLAELMAEGVNCLVLDEPTNHLDLEAIEQLESALEGFDGTLLLVTHDRAFLDAVHVTTTIDLGLSRRGQSLTVDSPPRCTGSRWAGSPRRRRRSSTAQPAAMRTSASVTAARFPYRV